mmetsp:Transcript_111579/g.204677  ORF Transcript_111579/g.204677 Transcript_111579/m.204677 type:complete len:858 (+) Transcript_111579:96-2669(+)
MCKDNNTQGSPDAVANSSDLSKAMMMKQFWKHAAPSGHCKRSELEIEITPPSSPTGKDNDNDSIDREEFLSWLFETQPGDPSLPSSVLKARAAALFAAAEAAAPRSVEAAWPKHGCPSVAITGQPDEQLWQEILVKFGASPVPAARDAEHLLSVIKASMDSNSIPFPKMPLRGKVFLASDTGITVTLQDARPFPFPCVMPEAPLWTTDSEKETVEKWSQGWACGPEELRTAFYESEPMKMDLTPWTALPTGVILEDECTSSQLQVWQQRDERGPLSAKKVERRRMALSQKLGELNLRIFEEVRPELEREASILEMRARWASDKALEARLYDEQAARGEEFVAWPIENERRWPVLPAAWKQHVRWFKMWRQRSPCALTPGLMPRLKRSDSMSSVNSWLSVSDISWVEVESRAEEQGWQVVLDAAAPALKEAEEAIKLLCKSDIVELKAYKVPPVQVKLTMEVVCVLLEIPPVKTQNGSVDYWQASQVLLGDMCFLERLLSLQTCLPMSALEAVTPYMSRDDFVPEAVGKASKACYSLCKWIRELYKYHVMEHAASQAAFNEVAQRPDAELLAEAQRLLDIFDKGSIQELKALGKPPRGVDMVCISMMHLLAGIHPRIELTAKGNVKDADWKGCQKLMASPDDLLQIARELPDAIKAGRVPRKNVEKARSIKDNMGMKFSVDAVKKQSFAAANICAWVIQIIAFYDKAAPPKTLLAAKAHKDCPEPTNDLPVSMAFEVCKGDLVEVKSLNKPPQPVMVVSVCMCILQPLGWEDADAGWAGAKAMLSDPTLLKAMQEYNIEKVTKEQIEKVCALLEKIKDVCEGENMKSVSKAAYGLLSWVRAIIKEYCSVHGVCFEEAL